jgi:transcriptional regulator with XRE-family HTH domain
MLIDQAIARVRAYAAHRGWTRNKLATEAGVAESTIRDLSEPNWSPTAATLRKLEAIVPAEFEAPPPTSRDEAA